MSTGIVYHLKVIHVHNCHIVSAIFCRDCILDILLTRAFIDEPGKGILSFRKRINRHVVLYLLIQKTNHSDHQFSPVCFINDVCFNLKHADYTCIIRFSSPDIHGKVCLRFF